MNGFIVVFNGFTVGCSLLTGGMLISALSAIGFGVGTDYPGIVVAAAAIFSAGEILHHDMCIPCLLS